MVSVSSGPVYWRFLHFFAAHKVGGQLLTSLRDLLPCQEWKDQWVLPLDGESALDWTLRLHNSVNTAIGKYSDWDANDLALAHPLECDICSGREHIHQFPWGFLHNMANHGQDALSLIQQFNAVYPCDTCKGMLLQDEPYEGETLLEWVHRNHERFCSERGIEHSSCCIVMDVIPETEPLPALVVVPTTEEPLEVIEPNEAIFYNTNSEYLSQS